MLVWDIMISSVQIHWELDVFCYQQNKYIQTTNTRPQKASCIGASLIYFSLCNFFSSALNVYWSLLEDKSGADCLVGEEIKFQRCSRRTGTLDVERLKCNRIDRARRASKFQCTSVSSARGTHRKIGLIDTAMHMYKHARGRGRATTWGAF